MKLSPIWVQSASRRLFSDDCDTGATTVQRVALLSITILSVWAWWPVLLWVVGLTTPLPGTVGRAGVRSGGFASTPGMLAHDERVPHVHLFHESRCAGESITVQRESDLCGLSYPSGALAKDNVQSVLLAGGGNALTVYGTCRGAEQPANPLLLEVVRGEGCADLKYPLIGSVFLTIVPEDDADEELEINIKLE